ncbi:MAG: GNAT family N-acetyltransferase [Actinobacteria bacterium 13_2_20CM_2_71_6]|nr:MAG: GNAT family N-acetyltransferase [Actinobacteria bacterium 13_2_20CM_2_71_6]
MGLSVVHRPDTSRYEAYLDGQLVGFTQYVRRPYAVDFVHTEIDPRFEGQGLGGRLAAGALDDVRAGAGRAVATCPFISAYIERHPEYADLLYSEARH